ncbi:MAG TPA: 4Fe-4S dicluster-binding protein, partial [Bryobacteraceae bacterium]|nr:4Fe-4S dicluster-binding protein [Bryobacteraceae bacterium]
IGGVSGWREAAEFFLLGCGTVQVCTAAMHYGFRIVEDMIDGLSQWMDEKGLRTIDDFRGASLPKVTEWKHLDLNYKIVARINRQTCIGCDLCYIACWDGAHQCIHIDGHAKPAALEAARNARMSTTPIAKLDAAELTPHVTPAVRIPRVDEEECVGCNLCWLVCPVENCITMEQVETGKSFQSWAMRSGPA